jgi:uncharacterized membrane protein YheB (UPF0754 family)
VDLKGPVVYGACTIAAVFGSILEIDGLKIAGIAGVIGAGTNKVAIRMLFKRISIFGIHVPFSGVIPNKREQITDAIVDSVEKEILPSEAILGFISEHPEIRDSLTKIARRKLKDASDKLKIELASIIDGKPFFMWLKSQLPTDSFLLDLADMLNIKQKDAIVEEIIDHIKKVLLCNESSDIEEAIYDSLSSGDHIAGTAREVLEAIPIRSVLRNQLSRFSDDEICSLVENCARDHLGWLEVWGALLGSACGLVILAL